MLAPYRRERDSLKRQNHGLRSRVAELESELLQLRAERDAAVAEAERREKENAGLLVEVEQQGAIIEGLNWMLDRAKEDGKREERARVATTGFVPASERDCLVAENAELRDERDRERLRYGQQRARCGVFMQAMAEMARKGQQEFAQRTVKAADAAAARVRPEDFVKIAKPQGGG